MCARLTASGEGGNVRDSWSSESVEMALAGCDIACAELCAFISAKSAEGVNHTDMLPALKNLLAVTSNCGYRLTADDCRLHGQNLTRRASADQPPAFCARVSL